MNKTQQWLLLIITSIIFIALQVSLLFNGVDDVFVYTLGFVFALIMSWFVIKLLFDKQ